MVILLIVVVVMMMVTVVAMGVTVMIGLKMVVGEVKA
jgi:hypothetical protein